jgi:dTDP-4-dehydrorhamnose 3,5-epimerase
MFQDFKKPFLVKSDFCREPRGEVGSLFKSKDFYGFDFVEDRFSVSYRGGVRGFHGDYWTYKLVGCVQGSIKLVVVSLQADNFGEKFSYYLDDLVRQNVLIPPGYLNAHQCLSNSCVLWYKWTQYYEGSDSQVTVRYDDPEINPNWPLSPVRISERDMKGKALRELANRRYYYC